MKKFIFILVTFISSTCFSQIKIVDSVSGNPVQSVSILLNNGILIGITDNDGKYDFTKISNENKITDTTIVTFSHIGYENYSCKLKDIRSGIYLSLIPKLNNLIPVVINSKGSNNDYLVLYGYYRSYSYNEKKIFGFADGLIEYYIPLNSGARIGKNYLANRLYEKKLEKDLKQRGIITVGMDVNPGVPYLEKENILNQISIPYEKNIINESKTLLLDKNNNEIGLINFDKNNNTNKISIDLLKIDTNKNHNFLGIRVKYIIQNIDETYQNNNLVNKKEDLLLFRSRYKNNYYYKNIVIEDDCLQEFIVFDKRYISKKEYNEIRKNSHFSYSSNSPLSFNIDLIDDSFKKYNISDIPYNIKSQFNNTLLKK
ncbi:MAG: hypothetical protein ACOYKI_02525 [Sediminibacterium sp.]